MQISIHTVPASKGLNWVTQSLDVAGRRPGLVLSAMLLGLFVLVVLAFAAAIPGAVMMGLDGADHALGLPFRTVWVLVVPPMLVMIFAQPVVFAGLLHVLREVDAGRPVGITGILAGMAGGRTMALASIGLVQVASSALNLLFTRLFGGAEYLPQYGNYMASMMKGIVIAPPVPEHGALLFVSGLALGFFAFTAQMYAIAQVQFQRREPLAAVIASLRASVVNVLPLTVAGLIFAVGLFVGIIVLMLAGGLLVMIVSFIAKALGSLIALLVGLFAMALVLTLMFGGIYLSWRDMFSDEQPPADESSQQVQAEM